MGASRHYEISSAEMRALVAVVLLVSGGCEAKEDAAAEVAREAEAAAKRRDATGLVAVKQKAPMEEGKTIPCERLLDAAKFTEALGEPNVVAVRDNSKANKDASAACSIVRGGAAPSRTEQEALLKKNPRLGVLGGDELCYVNAYCTTVEQPDRFRKSCRNKGFADDESLGSFACKQVVAQGADDVSVFHFFDEDSKCVIRVGGGPSNVDNDLIMKCARTARDTISEAQISAAPAADPAVGSDVAPASGSGS